MSESTEIANAIYYLASTVKAVGFIVYLGLGVIAITIALMGDTNAKRNKH